MLVSTYNVMFLVIVEAFYTTEDEAFSGPICQAYSLTSKFSGQTEILTVKELQFSLISATPNIRGDQRKLVFLVVLT